MSRTPEEAKTICDVALKFNAHSWDGDPDPSEITDEMYAKRADELVEVATQMSAKDSINDAVLEVLHVAQVAPVSEVTREAYAQRFGVAPPAVLSNGQSHDPAKLAAVVEAAHGGTSAFDQPQVSAPADSPAPAAGEVDHDADTPGVMVDIEDIYPGYDDAKVKDIKELILASAASGHLSLEEWEKIKAHEEANEGRRTILSLEPEFKASDPEPTPAMAPTAFPDAAPTAQQPPSDEELSTTYDQGPARARQEGLPIPPHVDLQQAPIVPVNITDISDKELSALGAMFHSLFARAQWLISQEEGRAAAAEHMERETEHDAYVRAYALHREQIPEEKRTQPTALEAARKQAEKDAETNEKVRTWRSRRVRHGVEVRELKALIVGFDKGMWRVDKELDRRARAATTARAAS